jgi:CBS domain-containing protein
MSARFTVGDHMSTRLVTLSPDMEILRAVHVLVENRVSGAPVVDGGGTLVGVLTERDCMRVVLDSAYHSEYGGTVEQYMARKIEVMAPDDNIVDAARRFHEQRYLRYPVLDGDRLVGQISRSDVMRAMCEFWVWDR